MASVEFEERLQGSQGDFLSGFKAFDGILKRFKKFQEASWVFQG